MLEWLPTTIGIEDRRTGLELDHGALLAAALHRETMFRDAGVVVGSRVVVGHDQAAGAIVDLLAAWRIGAAAVVVPASLAPGERTNVAALTRPVVWIGREGAAAVRRLAPEAPRPTSGRPSPPGVEGPAPDAPALILVTSGTTAQPKAVVHSHRSLQARLALNLAYIDRRDLERSLALLPLHFGHGLIGNCLTPLAAGAHLTLWPEPGMAGLAALGDLIDRERITFMSSVPAMWRIVLRASEPPRNNRLRRVHVGSSPLSLTLWEAIARWCGTRRVVNAYGMTETANWIGGYALEDGDAVDGLVGRPWGGTIRVRTASGVMAASGEGEVAVATPSLMSGYLDQPHRTGEVIQGSWFMTGDTGVIDGEGRLRLVGRRQHEINRGGVKIPLEEIDLLLEQHPAVVEACAFPVDDPVAGEIVAVAVVVATPAAVAVTDLLTWCQARIRAEAVPARIFVVESLPRSSRGKIDRNALKAALLGATVGE